MKKIFSLIFSLVFSFGFAQLPSIFDAKVQPAAPDYAQAENWAALPFVLDAADEFPKQEMWVSDTVKNVDVFFVHPTIYKDKKATTWNADVSDQKINDKVDAGAIKYQASSFNKTARVFAPRYRQGHLDLYNDTTQLRLDVLDFAYQDVKKAFEYYLKNYNNGRPIIIASHSQGTTHSRKLIKEFFDSAEAKKQLVCAYIVGFAVYAEDYDFLKPCQNATETNCYVSWSSFQDGYDYPGVGYDFLVGNVCVNPISWSTDTVLAASKSSVFLSLKSGKKYKVSARVKDDLLWVKSKLPVVGGIKNKHFLDFNLFWYNIRENAALRASTFVEKQEK